jgi:antitoxin YefM
VRFMTIILVMSETLPLADVKARLSEIVDRVEHEHERVVVTRHGRPAAVLVSPDELEALDDTLELLSNPEALAQIQQARTEATAGDVLTADQLRARYLTT